MVLYGVQVSYKPWKGRCGAERQQVANMHTDDTEKEFCPMFKSVSHVLIPIKQTCLRILQSATAEAERKTQGQSDLDPIHAKLGIFLGL